MNAKLIVTATLFVALLASAGVRAPAAAEHFTIRMRTTDGADGTTYYVSSSAVRITTPGSTDQIARVDRGTIIFIDRQNKTYRETPAAELRAALKRKLDMSKLDTRKQALLQRMGIDAAPRLTKVGTGESIAGYPSEKYSMKTGTSQGELWITQALQFPSAYHRDFNFLSLPADDMGNIQDVRGAPTRYMKRGKR